MHAAFAASAVMLGCLLATARPDASWASSIVEPSTSALTVSAPGIGARSRRSRSSRAVSRRVRSSTSSSVTASRRRRRSGHRRRTAISAARRRRRSPTGRAARPSRRPIETARSTRSWVRARSRCSTALRRCGARTDERTAELHRLQRARLHEQHHGDVGPDVPGHSLREGRAGIDNDDDNRWLAEHNGAADQERRFDIRARDARGAQGIPRRVRNESSCHRHLGSSTRHDTRASASSPSPIPRSGDGLHPRARWVAHRR